MRDRVAVVGGSGFIGTRLVHALGNARIVDRAAPQLGGSFVRVDVRDADALSAALEGVDVVYLLAAEHADDVEPTALYYEVNVEGAEHVILAARRHGIRCIVFTSTVAIYGLDSPDAPEEQAADPFNDYARSKWQAEQRLVAWQREDPGRSMVIVRPSVVFGEGNRGNVHNLLRQIHDRRFVPVGSGRNRKSMAYVGNLVAFMKDLVDAPAGIHVYNYADKPDLSMRELLQIACDELSTPVPRFSVPYPIGLGAGYVFDVMARLTGRRLPVSSVRIRKYCADTTVNTRRVEATGFRAPYTLEEGLRRMIRADFMPNKHQLDGQ